VKLERASTVGAERIELHKQMLHGPIDEQAQYLAHTASSTKNQPLALEYSIRPIEQETQCRTIIEQGHAGHHLLSWYDDTRDTDCRPGENASSFAT
jgi:hypothetical protein